MKKIKNLKPIGLDINLKYRCTECGVDHWASLQETKTKEFVIVCYCGSLLKPKIISNIHVEYTDTIKKNVQTTKVEKENTLDSEQIETAIKTLSTYGFTNTEAKELIASTLKSHYINNISDLVKTCLTNFGAAK